MAKKKSNPELRKLYAKGQKFLEARARQLEAGKGVWGTYKRLRARTMAATKRWHEARRFAETYDKRGLEWLCALGQKGGRPLSRLQVLLLIRLAVRKQRDALAEKCVKESWSVRRLEREVQLLMPRRKYGGRGPAPPASIQEAMIVTEKMASGLVRWIRVVMAAEKDAKQKDSDWDELPKSIRARLIAVTKEAELLSVAIEHHLKLTAAKSSKQPRRK